MFGINEILYKLNLKKELTKEEKFKILNSKRIDSKVIDYLRSRLNNLYIEVLDKYKGTLFELMQEEKLENLCFQTTESAIVFLNDDDYIERGILTFDKKSHKYIHSWICFEFNGIKYVFDPCLNVLCKKNDYFKIFDIELQARVSAKRVKEELIKQITAPKEENNEESNNVFRSFSKSIRVWGSDDISAPLYRNGTGYKAEIDSGKIKKLIAHYYYIYL